MKTTFKQYIQETEMPKAKDIIDLIRSINENGKFTIDGTHLKITAFEKISFNNKKLKSLVGGPSITEGDFDCSHNQLLSLEGAPALGVPSDNRGIANGSFSCSYNILTSLKGAPLAVLNFLCAGNELTSLEGCPEYINGNLIVSENNISSLKDIHKQIKEIGGYLDISDNPIKSHLLGLLKIEELIGIIFNNNPELERIINKYLPEGDIFACQQELIDAGYEEYAQL